MNDKELEIIKADQQLTGYVHAKRGYDLESLIGAMALTKEEWGILKKEYLVLKYLNDQEIAEIDNYLEAKHE